MTNWFWRCIQFWIAFYIVSLLVALGMLMFASVAVAYLGGL